MNWGMTFPLDGLPLLAQRDLVVEMADLGYTDLWSAETAGHDGFTPLVLAAQWAPTVRLGTAIIPVFTRAPATLAMCAASAAAAAPGRFVLGVGASSDVIVRRWNGVPFEAPYQKVRDTVRFLRTALTGEKVKETYETFAVDGFRLEAVPEQQPPILVAALRGGMLRLAGREADGAIINWLAAGDVPTVIRHVRDGADGADKEIVARIFVVPTDDQSVVQQVARMAIAAYLNVPVYRAFHEWLGRGDDLGEMWRLWGEGDRKGALTAIPQHVVDDLVVHGTPAECRDKVAAYADAGVTTPVMAILPTGADPAQVARDLAPAR